MTVMWGIMVILCFGGGDFCHIDYVDPLLTLPRDFNWDQMRFWIIY